jgi:hypothetical protein
MPDEIDARNERDEDEIFRRLDAIQDRVDASLDDDEHCVEHSAYNTPDGLPVDNLDQIAVMGAVQFWADVEPFRYHDGTESEPYQSPLLESPTWLELCKHANRMIRITGDRKHRFLEGVKIIRKERGVNFARFVMGS